MNEKENMRSIVKEALHTVAMECGKFTPEELADFEKIASGEITTEEYRTEILKKYTGLPDFIQESLIKRRKCYVTKRNKV